jgi:ArsR family transcriptional regulator, arsenate/arsenite/antimonite-responsive transcriptional repressor
MDELLRVMKALSDPGRLRILKLLEARELCACEIIGLLGLAQPTISRHMRVLAEAGLVAGRKVGPWVHYRLAGDAAPECAREMLARLAHWLEDDAGVAELRRRLDGADPRPGCAAPDGPEGAGRRNAALEVRP